MIIWNSCILPCGVERKNRNNKILRLLIQSRVDGFLQGQSWYKVLFWWDMQGISSIPTARYAYAVFACGKRHRWFSSTKSHPLKYIVSNETNNLVEMILDSYPVSPATKNDLRAPTRHFLWYAEQIGIKPQFIDDTIVMSFLIDEVPASNGDSTGRTLRCVKYATEYLRGSWEWLPAPWLYSSEAEKWSLTYYPGLFWRRDFGNSPGSWYS